MSLAKSHFKKSFRVWALSYSFSATTIALLSFGGYASATGNLLRQFCDETRWACILDVSERNQNVLSELPNLDEMVESLVGFLCDT